MTLPAAMHAADGLVVLSDRKEMYPRGPPRAGRRDEYGFNLALFVTASGARLPERDMEWHGRIDVRFCPAAQAAPPATRGGGAP